MEALVWNRCMKQIYESISVDSGALESPAVRAPGGGLIRRVDLHHMGGT